LLTIFRQWMARFERCITTNGEYNKWPKTKVMR
jgi:hypothetical protein